MTWWMRVILVCGVLLPATAFAGDGPAVTARWRCVAIAGAVGAAMALPTAVPLWSAGGAKGLAVATGLTDLMSRQKAAPNQDPTLIRLKWERENLWFMVGLALAGSIIFTAANLPQLALSFASVLIIGALMTDGFGTGACRPDHGDDVPLVYRLKPLAFIVPLTMLGLVAAPLLVLPTAAGAILILIAMYKFPAFPIVPGLGFTDLPAAIKRAGLMQTAGWPAIYLTSVGLGAAITAALLWMAPTIPAPVE